jgi:hypothetical protein
MMKPTLGGIVFPNMLKKGMLKVKKEKEGGQQEGGGGDGGVQNELPNGAECQEAGEDLDHDKYQEDAMLDTNDAEYQNVIHEEHDRYYLDEAV